MKSNNIIRVLVLALIIFANIGCDRISKELVRTQIASDQAIHFLNNHITLTKVENTGAFLSLGNALPEFLRISLLVIFPIIALFFAVYFLFTKITMSKFMLVGLSFIIGGGIGNLYDRIIHGSVTDFLHIKFGVFQTGIFNMADVSIMVGIFMILIHFLTNKKKPYSYIS